MNQRQQMLWLSSLLLIVFVPVLIYSLDSGVQYTNVWKRAIPITGAQSFGLLLYTASVAGRFRGGKGFNVRVHRFLGELTVLFILLHLLIVVISDPARAELVFIFDSTPQGAAGTSALICVGIVLMLGVFRNRTKLNVKLWRGAHVSFAWLAGLFAFAHILWINQLVNSPLWVIFFLGTALVAIVMWLSRPRGSNLSDKSARHKIH